jgi:hypothetical protein
MHALAGAAWVIASICFVIAGLALATGSDEQRNFAQGAALKIVLFNLMAAILVLLTGVANFLIVGTIRDYEFSPAFWRTLGIKVLLFLAMFAVVRSALRRAMRLRDDADPSAPLNALSDRISGMVRLHAAVALMGAIALLLGLWLMGA